MRQRSVHAATLRLRTALVTVLVWGAVGCASDPTQPVEAPSQPTTEASFAIIQDQVLTPRCAGCHAAGTTFANQSGLVLTEDVAYENLLNQPPKNDGARGDNLVRVSDVGLPGIFKSFLWEKINWPQEEHFLGDHPDYGSLMPLGGPPLTYGQMEFIRQWISAGAPRGGAVVDEAVLRDTRVYQPGPFAGLEPPAEGLHIQLGPFNVMPGHDREVFEYRELSHVQDMFVNRFEIAMRQGSHHFILHTFNDDMPDELLPAVGDLRDVYDENGDRIWTTIYPMLYHEFFVGTQTPLANYTFPPGVALRLPARIGVDLNSHYLNRGADIVQGEVHLNLHTVPASQVEREARVLSLNNQDFSLPPGQVSTVEKTYTFNQRYNVFQLVSHAHQYMLTFEVELVGGARDGELVYFADDWEHPPIVPFDPPLVLESGQGLKLRAKYDNWTDGPLGFGLSSEEEMMILFGYYYTD